LHRPGRGSSTRPAIRRATNRQRHSCTVSVDTMTSAAATVFDAPSAQARMTGPLRHTGRHHTTRPTRQPRPFLGRQHDFDSTRTPRRLENSLQTWSVISGASH
jgi:hypothetical protein